MGIDRACVNDALVAPNIVQQTVARLDAAASLHKCAQELEFKAGEVDPLAIDRSFMTRRLRRLLVVVA